MAGILIRPLFRLGQQIEQERPQPLVMQGPRHVLVAGTVPAASTAMGKQNHSHCLGWNDQFTSELSPAQRDHDFRLERLLELWHTETLRPACAGSKSGLHRFYHPDRAGDCRPAEEAWYSSIRSLIRRASVLVWP